MSIPPTSPGSTGDGTGKSKVAALTSLAQKVLGSRLVKFGFVVVALILGLAFIVDRWQEIHHALDRIGPLAAVGSLAFVLLALGGTLMLWRALMAGLGSPLPVRSAARILFVGQLGKYLPGSVWPVLAQMEMASELKIPRARTAAASILAMVIPVLTGLFVALVTLPFIGGAGQYWWGFLVAIPLAACLIPPVLNRLLGLAFKILRRPPLEHPLTTRTILVGLGWSFLSWICYGLQIWVLMVKVGAHPLSALPVAIGAFTFAFVMGLIFIPTPAGAGIRDVLLVALLVSTVGTGSASAIDLLSRVVTVLGDVIVAGSAAYAFRRNRKRGLPGSSGIPGTPGGGGQPDAEPRDTGQPAFK